MVVSTTKQFRETEQLAKKTLTLAKVEAEAGQLGEELPRRGAFFTLSASLGFSVGALGSDLAEKRTTRTSSLVVWSLSLFSNTVSGLVRRFI